MCFPVLDVVVENRIAGRDSTCECLRFFHQAKAGLDQRPETRDLTFGAKLGPRLGVFIFSSPPQTPGKPEASRVVGISLRSTSSWIKHTRRVAKDASASFLASSAP